MHLNLSHQQSVRHSWRLNVHLVPYSHYGAAQRIFAEPHPVRRSVVFERFSSPARVFSSIILESKIRYAGIVLACLYWWRDSIASQIGWGHSRCNTGLLHPFYNVYYFRRSWELVKHFALRIRFLKGWLENVWNCICNGLGLPTCYGPSCCPEIQRVIWQCYFTTVALHRVTTCDASTASAAVRPQTNRFPIGSFEMLVVSRAIASMRWYTTQLTSPDDATGRTLFETWPYRAPNEKIFVSELTVRSE